MICREIIPSFRSKHLPECAGGACVCVCVGGGAGADCSVDIAPALASGMLWAYAASHTPQWKIVNTTDGTFINLESPGDIKQWCPPPTARPPSADSSLRTCPQPMLALDSPLRVNGSPAASLVLQHRRLRRRLSTGWLGSHRG